MARESPLEMMLEQRFEFWRRFCCLGEHFRRGQAYVKQIGLHLLCLSQQEGGVMEQTERVVWSWALKQAGSRACPNLSSGKRSLAFPPCCVRKSRKSFKQGGIGSDLCFKNIMLAAMWKMDCRVAWEDVRGLLKGTWKPLRAEQRQRWNQQQLWARAGHSGNRST